MIHTHEQVDSQMTLSCCQGCNWLLFMLLRAPACQASLQGARPQSAACEDYQMGPHVLVRRGC